MRNGSQFLTSLFLASTLITAPAIIAHPQDR